MDMNTISMLMQLLSQKNCENKTQNASQEPPNAQNSSERTQDDKRSEQSAFARQNGIGEQIKFDFDKQEKPSAQAEILKGLASQNPMLAMLANMQGGKADIASLLPLVTSIANRQGGKTANLNAQNGSAQQNTQNDSASQNTQNSSSPQNLQNNSSPEKMQEDLNCQNARQSEKETTQEKAKTQRETFSPVAFAGYEVVSRLCRLLKTQRYLCR